MSKTMAKTALARELGMKLDDLDILLMEHLGQLDPEENSELSEDEANSIRQLVRDYKKSHQLAATQEETITETPIETTQLGDTNGIFALLDQMDLMSFAQRGTQQAMIEHQAYLSAKSQLLRQQLNAAHQRLKAIQSFDMDGFLREAGLTSFTDKERKDITRKTEEALELCRQINQNLGKKTPKEN